MISRYATEEIQGIWSDKNRFKIWLDIETEALAAMEKCGDAPEGLHVKIREATSGFPTDEDVDRILEIEKTVKHDVIAFLTRVEEFVGEDSRFLHLGMTSSDVLDTCFAIQLKQSCEIIKPVLLDLLKALKTRAVELKDQLIMGRSHGIHAEPTSLGLVFLGWYTELERAVEFFDYATERVKLGKISGAVGNFAHLNPGVEEIALDKLGLKPCLVSTQVVPRDVHALLFQSFSMIAGVIERIATNIRHEQRTEVREIFEPFSKGQKGSSAMPHKKNPILSENLCGLARLVRSNSSLAMENLALWHERDISHSSVERVIGPDTCNLVHFMLRRMTGLISGCIIDPIAIENNMGISNRVYFSQVLLNEMAKMGMPRQEAYKLVQRNALKAFEDRRNFDEVAASDSELSEWVSLDKQKELFNHDRYLKNVGHIFKRTLGE